MQQQMGSMKQSMNSETPEKSSRWKEILGGSLISLAIGILLIHYQIFVANDEPPALSPPNSITLSTNHDANWWFQQGEVYFQQQQWPLSLEAYSYICQTNPTAKQKIQTLLKDNYYATAAPDTVFNSDSLSVLSDNSRWQALKQRLSACH